MRFRVLIILIFGISLFYFINSPLSAQATITVNSTADNTTAGDGNCTLREAITNANTTADTTSGDCTTGTSTGTDTIQFNIAGAGPHTIAVTSALPTISSPVFIDGLTQAGADCQTGLMIVINGAATPASNGINLNNAAGSASTIRGLVVQGFSSGVGIRINNSDNHIVQCNFVGTDASGTSIQANSTGIFVGGTTSNNLIGTDGDGTNDANEGNLVSGNTNGVFLIGGNAINNRVAGNLVGTDITGTVDLGNTIDGIIIQGGANNNIVGTNGDGNGDADEGNLVSGNTRIGIFLPDGDSNWIAGNFVGTNRAGTAVISNGGSAGIVIQNAGTGNTIGTNGDGVSDDLEGNLVSGNTGNGISVSNDSTGQVIAGNFVGTDVTGTLDFGNTNLGITVSSTNNIIGTNGDGISDALEGNLVSGNTNGGISIGGSSNWVAGNFVGTDVTGTLDLGSDGNGINVSATSSIIGTNSDGISDDLEGNLVSGNNSSGINLSGSSNTVAGNFVGTDVTGTLDLGNTQHGISVTGASNIIGTDGDGTSDTLERNLVSGNDIRGISLANSGAINNRIAGNWVGVNASATAAIPNNVGIWLTNSANSNIIGTNGDGNGDALEGNLASGNTTRGIYVETSTDTIIAGNIAGTNDTGTLAIPNLTAGIMVNSNSSRTIVGTNGDGISDALEGNLVSGNSAVGIQVQNSDDVVVAGNIIGTNAAGTAALANTATGGIQVNSGSDNIIIGTDGDGISDDLEGNLISGNTGQGITIAGTVTLAVIAGNQIGTDITGTVAIPNTQNGIQLSTAGHRIGTNADGVSDALEGNLISGNTSNGININASAATGQVIAGNIIGLDASTSAILANGAAGINATSASNQIGGALDVQSNFISGNGTAGIIVSGTNSTGNVIDNNYIGTNALAADLNNGTNGIQITASTTGTTTVSNNWIFYHPTTGIRLTNQGSLGAAGASENNCIYENTLGVNNTTGVNTFFENNWWGTASGPSGVGTGGGDTVSANVDYIAFLTTAPTGCPGLVSVAATDPGAAENPLDTGTFTFDLGTVNTTGVTITINYTITGTAANGTDYSTITASIDIPNGSRTVTLTITPTDDFDIEAAETVILTLTSTSNPGFIVDTTPATLTITSNDVAAILMTPTTIAISEAGATATFDVSAQANPTSSVSMPVTTDGQCTVSTNPVVLAAGGMTPVTVTVTAVDDLNIEGLHNCLITVGDPTSTDTNFNALTATDTADVTANITDNDVASILVTPTTIAISEAGATATFDVSAQANPGSSVSIPVTTDGQCTVSANPVILAAGGMTPVTVTVTAVDDLDIEGAHTCAITVGDPSSTDTNFDALVDADTADVTANVTDNDFAGITVAPTSIAIAEGGATATFDISANVNPASSVSIPVTTDGQCTVSANPVILAAGGTTPVTVTVTAVNDLDIEGAHTCAITVGDPSSTDTNFDALVDADTADVTANVTDNDFAGITVAPTSIAIAEGGTTATFDVSAQANPTSSVSIPVTTDGQCTVSANPVILAAGGTTPVTVTVTAVNDLDIEGAHTCAITVGDPSSTDTNFDALVDADTADVTANVTDNDTASILVTPISIAIAEGGATATFDISAQANPTSAVSIPVTTDAQCTVSTNPVILAAGGTTPMTVTVTAVDDLDVEGAHTCAITVGDPSSTDTNFDALTDADTDDVMANVTDNDTASILVTPISIVIAEGGATATFDISTLVNPTGSISIPVTTDAQCTVSVNPVVLAAGGTTPVTVTVTAVDDLDVEGAHTCAITVGDPTSTDSNFDALTDADTADVTANVTDNDTASIIVTPTTIAIAEGGATATFDVSSGSNTGATVDVPITTDGQCLLSSTASPVPSTSLTVTLPAGSSTIVTVTVEAVDDSVAEGAHSCVITTGDPSSADANYNALVAADVADVTANVTDNDAAGISLASITITEGMAGVDLDVVLLSEPTGDVTVTFSSDAQCTLSTTTLTFTNGAGANPWDVPQIVTVTAVDDSLAEGAHLCVITHSTTSTDANYVIGSTNHNVDVVDNDTPGISLTSITITEGLAGVDLDILLVTEPTGDVTITLSSDAQCTLSTTTLTFTDSAGANPWDVPQIVTVTAVDDSLAEGAHLCVITYSATSTDPNYTIGSSTHDVDVVDNDTPAVLVAQTGGNTEISEDGATDTIDITLATEPTADVIITISTNGQCTVSPATLTFTDSAGATPWNVPQTVTVTAVDDNNAEGDHNCLITYTSSSADPAYDALRGRLRANVEDNDRETAAQPQISVFDPAISKLGELLPGQTGIVGEELEWLVTVSNVGTVAGTNVTVTDTLIPALQIDRVDAPGATVTIVGQTVTVVYPTLAVGQTVQFSIFTIVLQGVTAENTACVNAANQAVQECASAVSGAFSELPSTGEAPLWRYTLFAVIGIAGSVLAFYLYRKPSSKG